tara:strand:- start:1919 stop:2065 length:147 start_codon:yes stop_codon:yes gene_type:complete
MGKSKLKISDYLWAIPMIIAATIISILWLPVGIYKSFKHREKPTKRDK